MKEIMERAMYRRGSHFTDLLRSAYSDRLSDIQDKDMAEKAIKVVNTGLTNLQTDIVNKGIVYMDNKNVVHIGRWKYVSASDTAKYLIVPFLETLYPELSLKNRCKDGTYVYDSVISGDKLSVVLKYNKIGSYCRDCKNMDLFLKGQQRSPLRNPRNENYLRGSLRNTVVSQLSQSSDDFSSYGMVLVSNGIWYEVMLSGVEIFSENTLEFIEEQLKTQINGNYCTVLKNCGIPIFSVNLLDKDAVNNVILLKYFLEDYLNFSEIFQTLVYKLKLKFMKDVRELLKEV